VLQFRIFLNTYDKFYTPRPGRAGFWFDRNVRNTMVRGVLRNYRHSSTAWLSSVHTTRAIHYGPRGVGTGQAGS